MSYQYPTSPVGYTPVGRSTPYADKPEDATPQDDIDDAYGFSDGTRRAPPPRSPASRKRMWIGVGVAIVALIVIGGVVGGVVAATHKANSSNDAAAATQSSSSQSASPTGTPDPGAVGGGSTGGTGDANFQLDARLKKVFWGMACTSSLLSCFKTLLGLDVAFAPLLPSIRVSASFVDQSL